jgi:predicted nucleotidyltransferase
MLPDSSVLDAMPVGTRRFLEDFVEATKGAIGADVRSIVLFGSGAEGRLRETSDVNVLVMLARFEPKAVASLREPLAVAAAAVRLNAMFLVEGELAAAARLFAVKFADIQHRHLVLHGDDPFVDLRIPREAEIVRLNQVLLNLTLRLRQSYATAGLHEERLALVVADAAGPLRVSAQMLLELEGRAAPTPKEALTHVARELEAPPDLVDVISRSREQGHLAPGIAPKALVDLLTLLGSMRARADRLG